MAALKPVSSEEIQPATRPLEAEEAEAAEDWPGLQLGPTSWIERGQIWSLELQPYDATTSPVSADFESSAEGAEPLKTSEHQSEEGKRIPSAHQQAKKMLAGDAGRRHPNLKQSVDQTSANKYRYACDRCDKEFQWFSLFARHKNAHPGRKASRQSCRLGQKQAARCSSNPLTPVSSPQNLFADGKETAQQSAVRGANQNKQTKKLLVCIWCGRNFRWPSHLARHYQVECYRNKGGRRCRKQLEVNDQSSAASEPAPLEAEEITADTGESSHEGSTPITDQTANAENLYICEQCGLDFQRSSDLDQHQLVHSRRKTVRHSVCQLEACCPRPPVPALWHDEKGVVCDPCGTIRPNQDPANEDKQSPRAPVSLPLKVETMYVDASGRKSELMTDQITHAKDLSLCEQCGKGFRYPSVLARHQRVHFGKEKARQHQCHSEGMRPNPQKANPTPLQMDGAFGNSHKSFRQNSQLVPGQTTSVKKPHICGQCGKGFRYPSDLARHEPTHSRRKKDTKMSPPGSLKTTDQNSKLPTSYLCDECGQQFQFLSDFTEHVYTHSVKRPYSCAICGCQFKRYVQLKKHEKWHEMSEEEEEEEEEGGGEAEVVVEKDDDDDDWVAVKDEDEKTYQGVYEEDVPTENAPKKQLRYYYPMASVAHNKPFGSFGGCECGVCHKETSSRSELRPPNSVWEIGVNGLPSLLSLPQTCECGYCESFGDSTSHAHLTNMPSLSTGIAARCELASAQRSCKSVADKPAVRSSSGGAHKNVASTWRKKVAEDKPFACPVCPKSFSQPSYLAKHLDVHSTGKPYQCATCKKRFARRSYLFKHRRVHTVNLTHECPECGSYFTQVSYLRKHMGMHRRKRMHKHRR
ncbi:uncharacterized protein LOC110086469 isoform X1 [Pogona vitticeps]